MGRGKRRSTARSASPAATLPAAKKTAPKVRHRPSFEDFCVSGRIKEGELGKARIAVKTVDSFSALRAALHHEQLYEGDTMTTLAVNGHLVMSDTRDEYLDHIEAIDKATGRVLIHGLGLGCYLQAILAKPDVTHVDVVEISSDVIALIGPYFADDERVHIHQGDAYEFKFPPGTTWDVAWHDIWSDKCSDDLEGHAKLNRRYGRCVGWQGCWAHESILDHRRRYGW